jgi:hypothetical protein
MAQVISTNTFGCAKWIVSSDATQGTHTTIAGALTSASSGDTIFIRPGTYTENLTLKAGVNLSAFVGDANTPNVTIVGTCTMTTAGTVSITGVRLQTNSAALLAVTGSAASNVFLSNCYLNCSNNSGITYSSSSASSSISLLYCIGNLGTTGINYFAHSSAGVMNILYCNFVNSGASTTVNTQSAGTLNIGYTGFSSPITTSGSASLTWDYMSMDLSGFNATAATLGGNGVHNIRYSRFMSGNVAAVSVGNATTLMESCTVSSSNTNAVTGAGTITYSGMIFEGTSTTINTTTQTNCGTMQGSKNTAPAAGFLGEQIRSAVASGSAVNVPNNTGINITSINLTAGIWDITGVVQFVAAAGTVCTNYSYSINSVSATLGTAGDNFLSLISAGGLTSYSPSFSLPAFRVTLSATTTYYLVVAATIATSTMSAYGRISATRVG